jgi:hypothetical protein
MKSSALVRFAAAAPFVLFEAAAAPPPVPIAFDVAAIAGLPRGDASLSAHGETIRCQGVWLADLMARAGLPAGPAVRGAALAAGVLGVGKDGYAVLFGAAELEPGIGATRVLVADRCDGGSAASGGVPRLVVPGDGRAARSVRDLRSLTYLPVPTGAPVPH